MSPEFVVDYANLRYGEKGGQSDFNRMNWRSELLLTRNQHAIKDKRVLDIACNNGRLSYPCLVLGAKQVTGIEVRQELIDKGKEYLAGTEYSGKMHFVKSDVFDYLASVQPGEFDTILCFGFLYHTVRQVEFFRQVQRIMPDHVIIDTSVFKNYLWYGKSIFSQPQPPCLFMISEDPQETRNTFDSDGVAFWPTKSFLETMFNKIGYRHRQIIYSKQEIKDWSGMKDYRKGYRISYIAHRGDS